jgi:CspA family cold shock protein
MVMRGKVKWYSPEKGFGFIQSTSSEEIFVVYTSIIKKGFKALVKGQEVEFELGRDSRGKCAINVKIID